MIVKKELQAQFVSDVIGVAQREKSPEELLKYTLQQGLLQLVEVSPDESGETKEMAETSESREELRYLADTYAHRALLPKEQWTQRKQGESLAEWYNRHTSSQRSGGDV